MIPLFTFLHFCVRPKPACPASPSCCLCSAHGQPLAGRGNGELGQLQLPFLTEIFFPSVSGQFTHLTKLSAFRATSGNVLFRVYSSLLFFTGQPMSLLSLCGSKSRLLIPGGDRDGQVSEHGCFVISEGCSRGRAGRQTTLLLSLSGFVSGSVCQAPALRTGAGSWLLPPCGTAREGRCRRNTFRTSRGHSTTTHPGPGYIFLLASSSETVSAFL